MDWNVSESGATAAPIHKILFAGMAYEIQTTDFRAVANKIKEIARANNVTSRITVRCDGMTIGENDPVNLSYPRTFEVTKTMEAA